MTGPEDVVHFLCPIFCHIFSRVPVEAAIKGGNKRPEYGICEVNLVATSIPRRMATHISMLHVRVCVRLCYTYNGETSINRCVHI